MKIKNQNEELIELMQLLGWAFVEETSVTSYEVIDRNHRLSGSIHHDWYYGPAVLQRTCPAIRLRRPKGVSRSQERAIANMAAMARKLGREGFRNLEVELARAAAVEVGTRVFLYELSLPGQQWGLSQSQDYRRRGDWSQGEIEPKQTKHLSQEDEGARRSIDFLLNDNGLSGIYELVSICRVGNALQVNTTCAREERSYRIKRR